MYEAESRKMLDIIPAVMSLSIKFDAGACKHSRVRARARAALSMQQP